MTDQRGTLSVGQRLSRCAFVRCIGFAISLSPAWLVAASVLCPSLLYVVSFYLLRQRFPVTPFYPCRMYCFSQHPSVNVFLFDFYRPLHHGAAKEPSSFNEWAIEQKNVRIIYIRDIGDVFH